MYIFGQSVLRSQAEEVPQDYPNLSELIQNMYETMQKADGVGLAAPQIGLSLRLFVIDLDVLSDELPEFKGFLHAYINPEIIESGKKTEKMEEGCLSLPGIHEDITRPTSVHVKYTDENGQSHNEWIEGYLARVFQHEYDHLDGRLFIDHLSQLRKQMIKKKLLSMSKGKVNCTYKVKTN